MKWAWRLARVRGVDVYVHATFVVFLAWIALASRARGASIESTAGTLIFTLAVFGSVVLHEFGHVTMAQRFGVGTKRITLLPIGGVAELERMPTRPREELLVTLAGPLVNVVIGLACFAWLTLSGREVLVPSTGLFGEGQYVARLFWVQVTLVVFNALPAFPMDGGRVLRALLGMRLGFARATRIAVGIGQAMALLFVFLGLFGNPLLLFIGLMVWVSAQAELFAVETKAVLEGVPSSAAIEGRIASINEGDSLEVAARRLLEGAQRDFPVTAAGEMVGVLTREQLLSGLRAMGPGGSVRDAMTRAVVRVEASRPLAEVLERMRAAHSRIAALVEGGGIVGLVTEENILELIMVRQALEAHDAR